MANPQKYQQTESSPGKEDLRIVLLGRTGTGKSASGNTILGKEVFKELLCAQAVTTVCQKESAEVNQRLITVIDTPGLFDTNTPNEEFTKQMAKGITMAAPGPHVYLLVLSLGRLTPEEQKAVKEIQNLFGEESRRYVMVLFTRGDDLRKMSIEDFIKNSDHNLQMLLQQCGDKYHVFNNRNVEDHTQVTDLLKKIDSMVRENGGSFYNTEMFQKIEKALQKKQEKILKEREEDTQREEEQLNAKYEEEKEKMMKTLKKEGQNLEKQWREKEEEFLKKEEQIKKETNEELKKAMDKELKAQRGSFRKEMEREDQKHKEQMQRHLEQQKEEYEKEKENIMRQVEKKARDQAEKYLCDIVETDVKKAKTECLEEVKRKAAAGEGIGVGAAVVAVGAAAAVGVVIGASVTIVGVGAVAAAAVKAFTGFILNKIYI